MALSFCLQCYNGALVLSLGGLIQNFVIKVAYFQYFTYLCGTYSHIVKVMKDKISVVINTYNAERHLAEVLEAVRDFDEIVVCDMESTDGTLEIAERYGCRMVTFPKDGINIVEPARNFAIQQASYNWILVVDADEIITPELHDYLYDRISRPDCPAGLYISRHNKFLGRFNRGWAHDYLLRFFEKDKTSWPPYIHSVPVVQGKTERIPVRCRLLHLDDYKIRQWIPKMNDYTDYEVVKKSHKSYGVWALLWRPAWRFFRSFMLQGGFLMGRRGLISAQLTAIYQVILISKIMEKRIRGEE